MRVHPLRLVLLVALLGTLISQTGQAFAQESGKPRLTIREIDVSHYPDLTIYVYGENLGTDTANVPLLLQEDNIEQPIQDDQFRDIGVQIGIVIDASRNIVTTGNSGIQRYNEVTDSVRRFIEMGHL